MERKEKIDLNTLRTICVGMAGEGGAHFIKFPSFIRLLYVVSYKDSNCDFYELFDKTVTSKNILDRIENRFNKIEQGLYKNSVHGIQEHVLTFNYDPITGEKIPWIELMSEISNLIWYKKYDFIENNDYLCEDDEDLVECEDDEDDEITPEDDDKAFPSGGYILTPVGMSNHTETQK